MTDLHGPEDGQMPPRAAEYTGGEMKLACGRIVLALLTAGWLLPGAAWPEDDPETRAKALERKLIAPCCMRGTVQEHDSPASFQIRAEIRRLLAAGASDQDVLDAYVERYGPQILSMPPASGFNLVAYLGPSLAMLALGAILLVMLRRWRTTAAPAGQRPAPRAPIDPEMAERLRRELERLG
jgi:cytochrome c-type biogenesis protein CcmH